MIRIADSRVQFKLELYKQLKRIDYRNLKIGLKFAILILSR